MDFPEPSSATTKRRPLSSGRPFSIIKKINRMLLPRNDTRSHAYPTFRRFVDVVYVILYDVGQRPFLPTSDPVQPSDHVCRDVIDTTSTVSEPIRIPTLSPMRKDTCYYIISLEICSYLILGSLHVQTETIRLKRTS